MIVLFTDFGHDGPYVGQMKAVLYREAPGSAVVDLFSDAPACNPRAAAYLLAAYSVEFPADTIFLTVVDPGVGSRRRGAIVRADRHWFVGPDNGVLNVVAMRAQELYWWDIAWRPSRVSATFHGRDLFAPVAAMLARGEAAPGKPCSAERRIRSGWPADLPEVVYIDHFGNAITGIRGSERERGRSLTVNGQELQQAKTFSDVPIGHAFWYVNSNGLVEIAVNQGRAADVMGLRLGDRVYI